MIQTENVIRKHVAIIHIYSLMSALQRKIFNVLLAEVCKESHKIDVNSVVIESRIPFSKLSKAINFNSNNTKYLKESIDGLASLKIEWNLLKDKVPTDISFLNLRVLHGSPTFYQDATFNFSFHKIILNLVKNPSIYGTINLNVQSKFESKYAHSLYENSTRFVNLNKSKIIQLDTFKKLLGVDNNKYPTMRELTRNVLKPAVEEVNDLADFIVDMKSIKAARKIIGFEISADSKVSQHSIKEAVEQTNGEEILILINKYFGKISDKVLYNILSAYAKEYIHEKISYTIKQCKTDHDGFYPIRYFISALKNDYKFTNAQTLISDTNHNAKTSDLSVDKDLQLLQDEVNHWRRMLKISSENNVDTITGILKDCEMRLQEYSSKNQKWN